MISWISLACKNDTNQKIKKKKRERELTQKPYK
jgi:hypothetical protein